MSNKIEMLSISIIICTRDRPQKLSRCLSSVVPQMTHKDELIVVDGSPARSAEMIAGAVKGVGRLTYFGVFGGLSIARNAAISKARGDILVFTDDDCIAHPRWLGAIRKAFTSQPGVGIVFGRVLPYGSHRRRGLMSISLAPVGRRQLRTRPTASMVGIGTGNNMSIRRALFARIGLFLPWLGVGSFCPGTEEEEFSYRCLTRNIAVLQEPTAIVFHDRWMTKGEREKVLASYSTGYFAFLTFYALRGDRRARILFMRSIRVLIRDWLRFLMNLHKTIDSSRRLFFCAKGVGVAAWMWAVLSLRRIFFYNRHDAIEFPFP